MVNNPKRPAMGMRWHAAVGYCDWLSSVTGRRFRLPTEAEWDLACLAGAGQTWDKESSGGRTHDVGESMPNALGIHDLLGNVWEYTLEFERGDEYSPVLRGGAWNTPKAELRCDIRMGVNKDWYEADVERPRSSWWFTGNFDQGMRVLCVDRGGTLEDMNSYLKKIEIALGASERVPSQDRPGFGSSLVRVTGEVKNAGNRALDELDLVVFYLTLRGQPHFLDVTGGLGHGPGRASFGRCFPVLRNSTRSNSARRLAAGEKRAFVVEIPMTSDPLEKVNPEKFGAKATGLCFARDP
jgi:hypothetical protein